MASRVQGYKLERLKVESLSYDLKNPRFKGLSSGAGNQASVEKLVQNVHGIDVLEESIAKIGVVEPLYAVQEDSKYRVIEGNQRLFVLRQLLRKKVSPPAERNLPSTEARPNIEAGRSCDLTSGKTSCTMCSSVIAIFLSDPRLPDRSSFIRMQRRLWG